MAAKRRCKAKTKAGGRCKAAALKGRQVCLAHADAKTRESTGFVADNGKAGRPPKPRVVDVLRDRVEEEVDKVVTPLFEGLEASRGITIRIGKGQDAIIDTPDHLTRITAAKELLDRVYGKPKQATEITGANGGPLNVTFAELAGAADGAGG